MLVSVITLFPNIFPPIFNSSILKRAQEKDKIKFEFIDLRDFGIGEHKQVDDRPYGGGAGMILKVDVLENAIERARKKGLKEEVILLDPKGEKYSQTRAQELSKLDHIILVCGHYEGVDERIRSIVDREISIGDYVLTGGEIPAMVIVDSVTRLIPGVLKKDEAPIDESFFNARLEYPHYTRPENHKGKKVPEILLSGDHKKIEKYRDKMAAEETKKKRPDLQ